MIVIIIWQAYQSLTALGLPALALPKLEFGLRKGAEMAKNKVISFRVSEEEQQLFREILAERNLTPIQLLKATFLPKTEQERAEFLDKCKLNNERKAELEAELKAEQEQAQIKDFFYSQLKKIDIFLNHADRDRQALAIETAHEIALYLKDILALNHKEQTATADSINQAELESLKELNSQLNHEQRAELDQDLTQEIDFLNITIDNLNGEISRLSNENDILVNELQEIKNLYFHVLCADCDGKGEITVRNGFMNLQQNCPKCKGQGYLTFKDYLAGLKND